MVKTTLGIIGGGQLGSMLATAAKRIDIKTVIFCDDADAPAQRFSDEFIFGKYDDQDAIEKFESGADLVQLYTGFIYEGPGLIKNINKLLLKR